MLILQYLVDGDTYIFADDDILIISWRFIFVVNRKNSVYVVYNKRPGDKFFPKLSNMYQMN